MKIKKIYVICVVSFICLISGFSVFNLFLKTLIESGWYGFILLMLFISTSIWSISYWFSFKQRINSAKEVAKEAVSEMLKSDPELFRNSSPGVLKNQIEEHLINKVYEDKYVIFDGKY